MAFNPVNWGTISSSGNTQAVTLQNGTRLGALGFFSYQSTDLLALITAANYFAGNANILTVGDILLISGGDGSGLYTVATCTVGATGNTITIV